ncbi:MAG: hypothetical protein RMJ33_10480 [Saprospiraceae bacterium]|nr:hypothetical protein [Saprospiraceae bacterium]MDW8230252.1 hypothetical protein [Saprospiraceae bacterium]
MPGATVGQEGRDTLALSRAFLLQARFATADNLGNLYLITRQNAVEKYSPDGRLLTRYTNNRAGFATAIDATNPMKVIVWYADFRVVAFLDRNLTPLGELNLFQAGYPEVHIVAAAADGNLWLYDEVAFQLKKISPEGAVLAESQRLNALLPERLPIESLRDDGNSVYAFAPSAGLLSFDAYAQFRYRQPIEGAHTCLAAFERAACLSADHLLLLDRLRLTERRLPLPPAAISQKAPAWLAQGRLLVQNGPQLQMWEWRD